MVIEDADTRALFVEISNIIRKLSMWIISFSDDFINPNFKAINPRCFRLSQTHKKDGSGRKTIGG